MHEVSCLPKVYAAYQRMEVLGLRILGAVMNGINKETYAHENQPSLASI